MRNRKSEIRNPKKPRGATGIAKERRWIALPLRVLHTRARTLGNERRLTQANLRMPTKIGCIAFRRTQSPEDATHLRPTVRAGKPVLGD
jgi:hypothetical protein